MQTFLPYPSFERSARVLDYRRLGKQRLEADQILRALREGSRWENHPAVLMWKGYERALTHYRNVMIREWVRRGYQNSMPLLHVCVYAYSVPKWLGKKRLHSCHRARLLFKDPDWYGRFGWSETPLSDGYIWPSEVDDQIVWRDLRSSP